MNSKRTMGVEAIFFKKQSTQVMGVEAIIFKKQSTHVRTTLEMIVFLRWPRWPHVCHYANGVTNLHYERLNAMHHILILPEP